MCRGAYRHSLDKQELITPPSGEKASFSFTQVRQRRAPPRHLSLFARRFRVG